MSSKEWNLNDELDYKLARNRFVFSNPEDQWEQLINTEIEACKSSIHSLKVRLPLFAFLSIFAGLCVPVGFIAFGASLFLILYMRPFEIRNVLAGAMLFVILGFCIKTDKIRNGWLAFFNSFKTCRRMIKEYQTDLKIYQRFQEDLYSGDLSRIVHKQEGDGNCSDVGT